VIRSPACQPQEYHFKLINFLKDTYHSIALPPGVTNANWFNFFNAISFQIIIGPPVFLYAKSLGANATTLGVIVALEPLLMILQIPAAHYLARFGYRVFSLAGWVVRDLCVFATISLPLMYFLGNGWKLALLLLLQFFFALARGVTSGAWLPWVTEIVPENIRARFISRDQRFLQAGSLLAMLFCGLVLQKESRPIEFASTFLISAVGGAISLVFLSRVPDVKAKETLQKNGTEVPWRKIVTYPPFVRLVGFNFLIACLTGSLVAFTVAFLNAHSGLGQKGVLYLLAAGFIAGVASLGTSGRLLHDIGSKRFLRWGLAFHALFISGWITIASGLIAPSILALLAITIVSGAAVSGVNMANIRLSMNVMPETGRAHFFAFYSVIQNLFLGLSPILWGICLDAMQDLHVWSGRFEWNCYSVYFVVLLMVTVLTFLAVSALKVSPMKLVLGEQPRTPQPEQLPILREEASEM
jgi:MFS family permease